MTDIQTCLLETQFSEAELRRYVPDDQEFDADEAIARLMRDAHMKTERRLKAEIANATVAGMVIKNTQLDEQGKRKMNPVRAVNALLVRDLQDAANHTNVETLAKGYQAVMQKPLAQAAEKFAPNVIGVSRNQSLMRDAMEVVLGGQARNAEANELGTAIRQALDTGHKLAEDAGVDVGYRVNYFPQQHIASVMLNGGRKLGKTSAVADPDAAKVRWKNFVAERLDRAAMLDDMGNRLTDTQLDNLLEYVWATITTHGKSKRKPPIELQNRVQPTRGIGMSMERILHFDGAKAALEYAEEFGNTDYWGTLTSHLHHMAVVSAVHKTFGPEPEYVFAQWKNWALKEDTFFDSGSIENIWRNIVGFDAGTESALAQVGSAGRNVLSSAFMGSALISSFSDTVVMGLNAVLNGMNVPRMLARAAHYAKTEDREFLSRLVGHIDYSLSHMATAVRFQDEMGRGATQKMAEFTYRSTGMTGWMNMLRHTWMMEMMTNLGDHAGKTFDQLPPGIRTFLETYGLEGKWDAIRAGKLVDFKGKKVLSVDSLDDSLMAEVLGAIYTERDVAILHPDARVRALLNQGKNPGTGIGEMLRSGGQFKTFPATVIMHALLRYTMSRRLNTKSKVAYTAFMLVGMGLLGAVSVQLKEMIKGREPRDMTDPKFALAAFAQGGAVPGLAELIMDDQTRYGSGWLATAFGPVGGVATKLLDVPSSAIKAAYTDDIDVFLDQLSKTGEYATTLVPGQSHWYARIGVQRLLRDTLMEILDPNYANRQLDKDRNLRNSTGQEMWWGYDQSPDLNKLFGD